MHFPFMLRFLMIGVVVGAAVVWGGGATTRAEGGPAGTLHTQYVFLVDDSGSMRGEGGSDPDRLAVFAVRAMLAMLDPQDEASVLSLNAAAGSPALAPLSQNRQELENVLAADGTVARYEVDSTPCADALDRVWKVMDHGKQPGVPQVLFFLTDGKCSGGEVPTERWRDRKAAGDFDFYYLRFSETESSRELADLAGGENTALLSSVDAGAMIGPLASALARSQGYAAYVIDPSTKGTIPAFRGSDRVRVLVTGKDAGSELVLRVLKNGSQPQDLHPGTQNGVFQFQGDGAAHQAYRFAFATFADEGSPTTYQVNGAAENRWKGVVVPEYRLSVAVETHQGKCDDAGARVESLQSGSNACFRITAKDGKGEDVTTSIQASGARVKFEWTRDGAPASMIAASRPEAWTLEKPALEEGVYTVRPLVYLTGQEDKPPVRGFPVTLSVSNQTITMNPADVDVGNVHLGGAPVVTKVKLVGTFPPTSLSVAYDDKLLPPACVQVFVDGQELPATLKGDASPGRELEIEVAVHSWCGPPPVAMQSFPLRFNFGTPQTKTVMMHVTPRGSLTLPGDITLEVEAGAESVQLPGSLVTSDVAAGSNFPMVFTWAPDTLAWPQDGLSVALMKDGEQVSDTGGPGAPAVVSVEAGSMGLPLMASASACCSAGTYRGVLTIASADPPKGVKPVVHPVNVTIVVKPSAAGIWACVGDRVLKGLSVLAGLTFIAYLFNIWRNSMFLPPARMLSQRIQVLYYTSDGGIPSADTSTATAGQIKGAFRTAMRPGRRLSAWLRANPLRAGLPAILGGLPYQETLVVGLAGLAGSEQRVSGLKSMSLRAQLDAVTRIKSGGDGFFIVARGGRRPSFYALVQDRQDPIKVTSSSPTVLPGTQTRLFNPGEGAQIILGRPKPKKGHSAGVKIT